MLQLVRERRKQVRDEIPFAFEGLVKTLPSSPRW